ncbi:MAG: carboxylating nicotinate-nucleotide diphosphorylase [Methanomassiliicoccales archaeon]|nr:MAG: carboxylating nicotinate-nucleotide diphosphorylase [Methanomassiliicoccales archaeon]
MWADKIEEFIAEDVGEGDITSDILLGDEHGKAHITSNDDCVLAGLEEASRVFMSLGARPVLMARDGDKVQKGQEVLIVEGRLKDILAGERLALNFLMRMSGIATETRKILEDCRNVNPNVKIAATRKTTPGFRFYEKKAVRLGGGDPHRYGLFDGILIKDNHLKVVGDVRRAVERARSYSFSKKVEVEVEDVQGAEDAARAGADIIMLDNMTPELAEKCHDIVKNIDSRIIIEVSGGITPDNARLFARHADVISLGWITHSARSAQFTLHVL